MKRKFIMITAVALTTAMVFCACTKHTTESQISESSVEVSESETSETYQTLDTQPSRDMTDSYISEWEAHAMAVVYNAQNLAVQSDYMDYYIDQIGDWDLYSGIGSSEKPIVVDFTGDAPTLTGVHLDYHNICQAFNDGNEITFNIADTGIVFNCGDATMFISYNDILEWQQANPDLMEIGEDLMYPDGNDDNDTEPTDNYNAAPVSNGSGNNDTTTPVSSDDSSNTNTTPVVVDEPTEDNSDNGGSSGSGSGGSDSGSEDSGSSNEDPYQYMYDDEDNAEDIED